MSFDWGEYQLLAQEMEGQKTTLPPAGREARLRTAISRTYYAAFCRARNHLRDKDGCRLSGKDVHWNVPEAFRRSQNQVRRKIGHDLRRLHFDRCKADYDDTVERLEEMCQRDMLLGRQVLHALNEI